MSFIAVLNSDSLQQLSYDTLQIEDLSTYDGLDGADFTARTITIQDKNGDTPVGYDEPIAFPIVDGYGDLLEINFPLDMAVTLILTYTPVISDGSAVYTRTISTIFAGNSKALHSSRTHKSEVAATIRPASLSQYRNTTTILSNLIDSADYEASVGNLESAQDLLDKASTLDTDTITF